LISNENFYSIIMQRQDQTFAFMEGKIVIDSCFTHLTSGDSGVLVNITNQNNYFTLFCDQYVGYKGILELVRK